MSKVYIRWRNGTTEIQEYANQSLAYAVWIALPRGVRAAFRGACDNRPVYSWDYVDRF
jgi:hypothetical protein